MAENKNLANAVLEALKPVQDPELHRGLVELGMIKNLTADTEGQVRFTVELTTPACPLKEKIGGDCRAAVEKVAGVKRVDIDWSAQVRGPAQPHPEMAGIKNIILVASGKGGVGKSTVATNIAVALADMGASVGLMDADMYGPSIPTMMGHKQTLKIENGKLQPAFVHGVKLVSIGFFVDENQPIIWRGPMLHKAVAQFFGEVDWGQLDYLVVDLPPGTGDIQLSIAQLASVSGGVLVSTPQQVALKDVIKAWQMFRQPAVNIPILGLVENMSGGVFGTGGAKTWAEENQIPCLGVIPLDSSVSEQGDAGKPVVIAKPQSPAALALRSAAQNIAAQISMNAEKGLRGSTPIQMLRT